MTQATVELAGSTPRGQKPALTHGILESISRFLARRRTQRELARLDDRLLDDIGLTRSDIQAAATWSSDAPTRKSAYWG